MSTKVFICDNMYDVTVELKVIDSPSFSGVIPLFEFIEDMDSDAVARLVGAIQSYSETIVGLVYGHKYCSWESQDSQFKVIVDDGEEHDDWCLVKTPNCDFDECKYCKNYKYCSRPEKNHCIGCKVRLCDETDFCKFD